MKKLSRNIQLSLGLGAVTLSLLTVPITTVSAATNSASTAVNGVIGSSITVASSGPVSMNLTPTSGAVLSSAADTVTVSTNNAGGYTLTLQTSTANRSLTRGSDTIAAHTGTLASPTPLAVNSWGFRVDGLGGFGSGPTSAETNTGSSTTTWAGVPASGSPATIKTTAAPSGADTTSVWYGLRADATKPSGTYTNTVVYTAVTN